MTAVHAMATYTWHSMPRIQLAILWTGIEALFGVTSELSFRISLYIANFLADDVKEAKSLAYRVKKLYGIRSSAVHGNKLKDKDREMVKETAILLQRLIRKCIANKMLPNIDELLFFDFDYFIVFKCHFAVHSLSYKRNAISYIKCIVCNISVGITCRCHCSA